MKEVYTVLLIWLLCGFSYWAGLIEGRFQGASDVRQSQIKELANNHARIDYE